MYWPPVTGATVPVSLVDTERFRVTIGERTTVSGFEVTALPPGVDSVMLY